MEMSSYLKGSGPRYLPTCPHTTFTRELQKDVENPRKGLTVYYDAAIARGLLDGITH